MRRNPVLVCACAGHFAVHLLLGLHATAAIAIERDGGWGTAMGYGRLVALWTVGAFLLGAAAPLAGWFADRVGAARMMVVFFLGSGAATTACAAADGPLGLGAALAGLGLFAAIYHPVALAWLVSGVADGRRGWAVGVNGAFGSLGVATAPLVAGTLAEAGDWRLAYVLPGVATMLLGLILASSVRRGTMWEKPSLAVAHGAAPRASDGESGSSVRPFVALGIVMLCNSVLYAAFATILPRWTEGRVLGAWPGADLASVGMAASAVFLAGGFGQLLVGKLADRCDTRALFLLALAAKPPLLLVAVLATGPTGLVSAALLVFAIDLASPSESLLLARWAPVHRRGFTFGVRHAAALAATPAGVWLAAEAAGGDGDRGGMMSPDGLLLALAVLAAAAVVAGLGLPRGKHIPRDRTSQASRTDISAVG